MGWLVKFVLGKVSGPVLFYVILGLLAANALTGFLLKKAWADNATAILECENQALRDANSRNLKVSTELRRIQDELTEATKAKLLAGVNAEKEIDQALKVRDAEHAEAMANMEAAKDEITDDEFWCASEPVPLPFLNGMRDAATAYNNNRNNSGARVPRGRNTRAPIAPMQPD